MSDKHRLEFDFSQDGLKRLDRIKDRIDAGSQDGLKRLDRIKDRIDAGSRAEVVRRALALFDYATGLDVYVHRTDGTQERLQIL